MYFTLKFADSPNPLVTPAPQAPVTVVPNRGAVVPAHGVAPDILFAHWSAAEWSEYVTVIAIAAILTFVALSSLSRMLHAWRSTAHLGETDVSSNQRSPRHSFSLLVPVRHEGRLMVATLDELAQQDHPDFEVIAIVGDDDPETEFLARETAAMYPDVVRVVIDDSDIKNRPKALNHGLREARGDAVGTFNVGDVVHPGLLRMIDSRFSETAADIVQGGVQAMNIRSSWWSLRSALENYFWFRSGLVVHSRLRSVPLSDSTAFVKRNWLDWAGGWDEDALAEDAELGVRLTSSGARVGIAYLPDAATRQDNPSGIGSLLTQRTRQGLGSLQILGKSEWRNLPRVRQRDFARYELVAPFFRSATAMLMPFLVIFALLFALPPVVAVIAFLPLGVSLVKLAVEIAGLSDFGRLYHQRVRAVDYLGLILGTFPYQVVLAAAALNALITGFEKDYSLNRSSRPGIDRNVATSSPEHVGAAR